MNKVNALEECMKICANYRAAKMSDVYENPSLLLERMKELGGYLVYLKLDKVFAHEAFNTRVNELIEEGMSKAAAETKASAEIPQLYKLRNMMEAFQRVHDTMRSHLSYIKTELNTIN
jgi:hypothetical protein